MSLEGHKEEMFFRFVTSAAEPQLRALTPFQSESRLRQAKLFDTEGVPEVPDTLPRVAPHLRAGSGKEGGFRKDWEG